MRPSRARRTCRRRDQRRERAVRQWRCQGRALFDRLADAVGVAAVDRVGECDGSFGVTLADCRAVHPEVAAQARCHRAAGCTDDLETVVQDANGRHGPADLKVLAQAGDGLLARLA